MSVLAAVGAVIAAIAGISAIVVAGPQLWKFVCLPGRIEERFEQLDKLDKLDGIELAVQKADANAQRAASIAEAAHDEWKGATRVLTHELANIAAQSGRQQQRLDDHERRIVVLEDRIVSLEERGR